MASEPSTPPNASKRPSMADVTDRNRFQPALFDRLCDDAPQGLAEPRECRAATITQLRASVLRDLSNLLNAHALYGCTTLAAHPLAEASVLNYGLWDVTGRALSSLDVAALAGEIERAVARFEPRIRAQTLRVAPLMPDGVAGRTSVTFLVEGDLLTQPCSERLYFRTELDLESGQVRITDGLGVASSSASAAAAAGDG